MEIIIIIIIILSTHRANLKIRILVFYAVGNNHIPP
jgi:hypothetical protein